MRRRAGHDLASDPDVADARHPLVTATKIKGAYRLVALCARAHEAGLTPGLALADARARIPAIEVHEADPDGERETLLALTAWCKLFTPLAAPDGSNGIVLDITGAAHLCGGESALLASLTARLNAQGFCVRAAIASTPAAAWALARYDNPAKHGSPAKHGISAKHAPKTNIVPEDMMEDGLAKLFAPLPLAALRIEEATAGALAQAGLRRIGDLLMRPRAPLTARFGANLFARLDEVLGRLRTPVSPLFDAPAFAAERRFAEGLTHRDHIEAVLLTLAADLCGLLARHGQGARQLGATLFRVDGAVREIEAGTSRPLRDPQTMARLFHERIETIGEEGLDTGYGFDVIRLSALQTEKLAPEQTSWEEDQGASAADLIDRLGARFGLARITKLVPQDKHRPEDAARAVPAAQSAPAPRDARRQTARALPAARDRDERERFSLGGNLEDDEGRALPARPVRLLRRPEPVETLAGVPDGPPLRFRWRRVLHHVAAIEGPERIAPDWWNKTGIPRDYFRAEDTAGQRFWLFRDGLYDDTAAPRWYMHGLFA